MAQLKSKGYGVKNSTFSTLKPIDFERTEPKEDEVLIDILYCGVCHSDLHQVKNDWGNSVYPCIPGHEIIGRVAQAGSSITKFKTGDKVGIVGLGGLGHMAVKLAKAMGAEVTVITSSKEKKEPAEQLGADHVLFENDEDAMTKAELSLDFILVTIPDPFDINPYINL